MIAERHQEKKRSREDREKTRRKTKKSLLTDRGEAKI
jgi:hypothetical protein